jgi:hypothetical protein
MRSKIRAWHLPKWRRCRNEPRAPALQIANVGDTIPPALISLTWIRHWIARNSTMWQPRGKDFPSGVEDSCFTTWNLVLARRMWRRPLEQQLQSKNRVFLKNTKLGSKSRGAAWAIYIHEKAGASPGKDSLPLDKEVPRTFQAWGASNACSHHVTSFHQVPAVT